LPKGWLWCRLGNIVQHNAGKTLHKGNNTGILKDYLTTSNVYWGFFKLDNVKQIQIEPKEYERCTATKGDLLICEGGDVGRSAIWNEDYEICIQNHIHRVRPYCQVNSKYIYYYMNYLHSNNLILDYKKGMGIGNLSGTALASIKLTLPPLEEQQAIVEKVDLLMNKCLKLSQEIETLEKHGITLMKAMFNETFETKTEECQD
jgi:type I restriction enzyme S subunit